MPQRGIERAVNRVNSTQRARLLKRSCTLTVTSRLRLKSLNCPRECCPIVEGVSNLAFIRRSKIGEIEFGTSYRSKSGGHRRWWTCGTRQARTLYQIGGECRRACLPFWLKDIPHRFAIRCVGKPCRENAIRRAPRILPDKQSPTGIVWVPPMAGIVEADVWSGFVSAGVGDGERRFVNYDRRRTILSCRSRHCQRVAARGQLPEIDFFSWSADASHWPGKGGQFAQCDCQIVLQHAHAIRVCFVRIFTTAACACNAKFERLRRCWIGWEQNTTHEAG
jgi:hypothetical protein